MTALHTSTSPDISAEDSSKALSTLLIKNGLIDKLDTIASFQFFHNHPSNSVLSMDDEKTMLAIRSSLNGIAPHIPIHFYAITEEQGERVMFHMGWP